MDLIDKKQKICKICGQEIIAPIDIESHFSCETFIKSEKSLDIDTKDIIFNESASKNINNNNK